MNYRQILPRFRNRWTLCLQWLAMLSFLAQPLVVHSYFYWSDTDNDGLMDFFFGVNGSNTLGDLDLIGTDIDGDNATNTEEAFYGSDPFAYDTDGDGLSDGDEIHLAIQQQSKSYSLTAWDSDADGVSDHDDFHGFFGVTYPGGQLPNFPNASYFDYDGDGIKNHEDSYPDNPNNNDPDGDGIDVTIDPVPGDAANPSPNNGYSWYSDALGDVDGDGILNFWDSWPYDPNNGSTTDSDGDGIYDSSDPLPNDPYNYSEINYITWYGNANGDDDGDNTSNYYDPSPYPPPPDSDGDGLSDGEDPAPNDSTNYSGVNGTAWYGDALGDNDGDSTLNYYDDTPNLPPVDTDGDGFTDQQDPAPQDTSNYSSVNNTNWYGDALGNLDSDNILNFYDPKPGDADNFSSFNQTTWGNSAADDPDGDMIQNYFDPAPNNSQNISPANGMAWGAADIWGNTDSDSFSNYNDPAPNNAANFSSFNQTEWGTAALEDNDSDLILNFFDPAPTNSINHSPFNGLTWGADLWDNSDGDSYPNFNDPAPTDATNYSSTNDYQWHSDALGDADGDATLNFFDPTPWIPPPADHDQDGLDSTEEAAWGTSDNDPDSDDDGLTDFEEVEIYSTVPTNKFYLSQQNGWGSLYTDYQLVDLTDTDGDTIPDRVENHYASLGMSRLDAADSWRDMDLNGISNRVQYSMGIALNAHLASYDLDMDGMTDVFEDYYALNKESFNDAVADVDGDGVTNYEEMRLLLSPRNSDTRGSGSPLGDLLHLMISVRYPGENSAPPQDDTNNNNIPDWADTALMVAAAPDHNVFTRVTPGDLDGDGMSDLWEHRYGRWKFTNGLQARVADAHDDNDEDGLVNIFEQLVGTSPVAGDSDLDELPDSEEDTDGDGLSDERELLLGTNPLLQDSDGDGVLDGNEDADGDGRSNALEFSTGTSPLLQDSDADGVPDSLEITQGTDPLNKLDSVFAITGLRVFTPLDSTP